MREHFYGLTVTQTVTPSEASIGSNIATIDADIGDVAMWFLSPGGGVASLDTAIIDAIIIDTDLATPPRTSLPISLNVGLVDANIFDVPLNALAESELPVHMHAGVIDASVADVPLSLPAPLSIPVDLHIGEVSATVFDVPLSPLPPNALPLDLSTGVIDAVVADVMLDTPAPAEFPLSLTTGLIDGMIGDVALTTPNPNEHPIDLHWGLIDATVADVLLDVPPPTTVPVGLQTGVIDATVADVPMTTLAPPDAAASLSVAHIDAAIGDVPIDASAPPDFGFGLNLATIDATIIDVALDTPTAGTVPIPLNIAIVDAVVSDVPLAVPGIGDLAFALNVAKIDATIADVPLEHIIEAASFDGTGLLKGPTSNYATTDSTGTLMFWLEVPVTVAEDRRISFAANAGSTPRIQFFVESDIAGTQVIGIETDDGTIVQTWFFEPDNDIFDGTKHWICIRGNGSSYEVFIDGVPATGTEAGPNTGKWFDIQQAAGTNFNTLQIGGFDDAGTNVELFYGILDEVVHVGTALSNGQILDLWNSGDGATIPEMTAATWWSLVRSAYEMAKDDTRNWGDDYLTVNNLTEDPSGFLEPGGSLVNGGWAP